MMMYSYRRSPFIQYPAVSPPPTEKMASLTIADAAADAAGDDDIEEDATEDVDFNEYLGKRVAKVFLDEDADDESYSTYRGSVTEVPLQGDEDPFFSIHYDDGDDDSVYIDELKSKLLYSVIISPMWKC
jgi:hypothetical protein